MTEFDVLPDDVQKRDEVSKIVLHNIERAVTVARSIQHPWYRCQALSSTAKAYPNKRIAVRLIEEAFQAAEAQEDINRVVTVASWPLKVCMTLAPDLAQKKLTELLELAEKEPHTLCRGHALYAIIFAVSESPTLKAQAIPSLVNAITLGHGWRIERLIADTAMLIHLDYPHYLTKLLAAHPENQRKRKLIEALRNPKIFIL